MRLNEKEITTVVSDFDGTLLRPGMQKPSERFFEVVEELLKRGIGFVAASGRQYYNLRNMMPSLADRIGFICENGTLVVWKGEVLHKLVIEEQLVRELIADMLTDPVESRVLVSGVKTCYILDRDRAFVKLIRDEVKNSVEVLHDFGEIDEEMIKASIYYPGGIPASSRKRLEDKYGEKLLVVNGGNGWLDFTPKESGKGNALKKLASIMGFELEKSVSFGDNENDISMLELTGVSYAMTNADDQVRAAAQGVCDSVEELLAMALDKEREEQIEQAMRALKNFLLGLCREAGKDETYAEALWKGVSASNGLLHELAYYYDTRKFWCGYKVAGYTLADVLVWQVDHFKAYMDREKNRYDSPKLLVESFEVLVKMEEDPTFFANKMVNETGTDIVTGKIKG